MCSAGWGQSMSIGGSGIQAGVLQSFYGVHRDLRPIQTGSDGIDRPSGTPHWRIDGMFDLARLDEPSVRSIVTWRYQFPKPAME